MNRSSRTRVFVFVAASACLAACGTIVEPRKGELILAIDSDMAPGVDFDRLQIEIRQQGFETLTKTFREFGQPGQQDAHFPATFNIISNGNADTRIQLRVVTGKTGPGGGPDVGVPQNLIEAITAVPTDRTAMLRVRIEWLCHTFTELKDGYAEGKCPEGSTCLAGKCIDWNVNANELPAFSSREVFGGGSERGEGACFDTGACFSGAHAVALDAKCTFADDDPDTLNVALVPQKNNGGICVDAACSVALVPLDREPTHGWREDGGRVALPARVCELLKAPEEGLGLRGVVINHACPAKSVRLPTCGPWSSITTNRGTASADPITGLQ